MIIGGEMAKIRHGGGVPYGPIFGGCAVWPVFRKFPVFAIPSFCGWSGIFYRKIGKIYKFKG